MPGEKRAIDSRAPPVLVKRAIGIITIKKATLGRWIGAGHDRHSARTR